MIDHSTDHESPGLDAALLPTEDEVRHYERTGWYISRPILPHALLDATRTAIDDHHHGRRDHKLPRPAKFSDWKAGDGDGVRNNEFCSLQNDGVKALVMQPIIGAIAARLARARGDPPVR